MDVGDDARLGIAGGVAVTVVYVAGAFLLDIFVLGIDVEGRWLTILTDVLAGNPSNSVAAYLLGPGFAVGVLVFATKRLRGFGRDKRGDLETLAFLVLIPVVGMFVIAFGFALYQAVRVVGVFGVPLALPFALFFVAVADGLLFVATATSAGIGYALVEGAAYLYRRIGATVAEEPSSR